jgi:uncharacterized protein
MPLPQQEAARREAFGYICRGCSNCCPHKIIQVNPYEIARLARFFGISTAEFRETYTEQGGAILKRDAEDTCIFLDGDGCSVHQERPLVCRLYPLGRRVEPDGAETWGHTVPHPQSEGEYTKAGTIADFIAAQGALPFMQAADDYADWVRKAHAAMENAPESVRSDPAGDLLDMDAAISEYCAANRQEEPDDIETRRVLHLKILNQTLEGETHDG